MKQFFNTFFELKEFWNILSYCFIVFVIIWLLSRVVRFVILKVIKKRDQKRVRDYSTTSL
ncbi:MAG: hypothetical protein ACI89R_000778, partial [Candidatus Azotimanducaceae bacterium]